MSEVESILRSLLAVFAIGFVVRVLVRKRDRVSFASILVFVGVVVSILGISIDVELTSDLILAVLLPAIIFHGTTTINVRQLRQNALLIAVLTVVGLPLAIVILGGVGTILFGFPSLVALLFAAVILPTDPAAVLSLFDEFDVAERLSVTIEGESLLNDGVAIVIFSTFLTAYESSSGSIASLASPVSLAWIALDIVVVGGGGLIIGAAFGYLAHLVMRRLDDEMAMLLLTVIVAYGTFLVTEGYLGLSGVLAVVGAGLLMGAHEETHEKISEGESRVQDVWSTASFLVTTVLYVLIGAEVHISAFVDHAPLVILAVVLVVVVRALTIYPLVTATNRALGEPVPIYCQHIMVWGGLHTVVPDALALSLPSDLPFLEELQTMVFGVAVISIVVQGLLMPSVLTLTGLADFEDT